MYVCMYASIYAYICLFNTSLKHMYVSLCVSNLWCVCIMYGIYDIYGMHIHRYTTALESILVSVGNTDSL